MSKLKNLQTRALRAHLAEVIKAGQPILVQRRSHNVAILIPLKEHYRWSTEEKDKETRRVKQQTRRGDFALD